MGCVLSAVVDGRCGLAVGLGGCREPVSASAEHLAEVARHVSPPERQFSGRISAQRSFQRRGAGAVETGDVLAEQFPARGSVGSMTLSGAGPTLSSRARARCCALWTAAAGMPGMMGCLNKRVTRSKRACLP
jgi:hypothetical protein